MKKVINLLSVALMALAFVACSSNNTPEGVVTEYLKALQKNDSKKVISLFHFTKELSDEDEAQYVQMIDDKLVKQNEKKQGIASFEITETEMAEDEQSAVVRYTIHYGDGSEDHDKQKVMLVDGKWMLDSGK